jgi:hypothetical protein
MFEFASFFLGTHNIPKREKFTKLPQNSPSGHKCHTDNHGCQIFLATIYQNGKNVYKGPQNSPNGRKIYKMDVGYSKEVVHFLKKL